MQQIEDVIQNKKAPKPGGLLICNNLMVRERGLEPPRVTSLPPQSSASTDSATRANNSGILLFCSEKLKSNRTRHRFFGL